VSSHLCTDWSVVELRLLSLAPHPRTHLPLVEAQSEVHGLVNSGFCLLHLIPYMIFHLSFVADLEQTVRMGCLLHLSLAEFNSITPALCCKAQVNLWIGELCCIFYLSSIIHLLYFVKLKYCVDWLKNFYYLLLISEFTCLFCCKVKNKCWSCPCTWCITNLV